MSINRHATSGESIKSFFFFKEMAEMLEGKRIGISFHLLDDDYAPSDFIESLNNKILLAADIEKDTLWIDHSKGGGEWAFLIMAEATKRGFNTWLVDRDTHDPWSVTYPLWKCTFLSPYDCATVRDDWKVELISKSDTFAELAPLVSGCGCIIIYNFIDVDEEKYADRSEEIVADTFFHHRKIEFITIKVASS